MRDGTHLAVMAARGITNVLAWLLVHNWRTTFPVHVMLMLLVMAGVINSRLAASPVTAVLLVALLAGFVFTLVTRYGPFRENRLFGYVAVSLGSAWVLLTRFGPFGTEVLADIAFGLLLVFGAFWALDHTNKLEVKVRDQVKGFEDNLARQERTGAVGCRFLSWKETGYGWEATLGWDGAANSVENLIKHRLDLEADLSGEKDTLTVEPVYNVMTNRAKANQVRLRCVKKDPLREVIAWDGKALVKPTDEFVWGTFEDTDPISMVNWRDKIGGYHMLVCGGTRGGKSAWLQLMAVASGLNRWSRHVFIDLKGGSTFAPLQPMGWMADNPTTAMLVLELVTVECQRRALITREMGWPGGVWQPSEEHPLLFVWLDEIAELLGEGAEHRKRAMTLIATLARLGAGVGVLLRMGTQEPTKEALGTTQIMTQILYRVCFRLNMGGRMQWAIPKLSGQVEPNDLRDDVKGLCYADTGSRARTMQARAHFMDEKLLEAKMREYYYDVWGGNPPEIAGFTDPALPEAATVHPETWGQAQLAYAQRALYSPETLSVTSERVRPEDAPNAPEDGAQPYYEPPTGKEGGPRRKPKATTGPGVSPDSVITPGPPTPQGVDPEDRDTWRCNEWANEADAYKPKSPIERPMRLRALELAIQEHPGSLRSELRHYIHGDRVVNGREVRSDSWLNGHLKAWIEQDKVHTQGPDNNRRYYWGPAPTPELDPNNDQIPDDDTEDEDG